MKQIKEICSIAPVIPVLVVNEVKSARPLAEALVNGGLPVVEVTLRTPVALDAISEMTKVPGAVVGAGTLLTPQDVLNAKSAGAIFGVSPGATDVLLKATEVEELPFLPGASSASEVMSLMERGYDMLKFFPAQAAGGVRMLKSFSGPLPQVSFCPTGGVSPQNISDYLELPNVVCVGGTWIAPTKLVEACDWEGIQALASRSSR